MPTDEEREQGRLRERERARAIVADEAEARRNDPYTRAERAFVRKLRTLLGQCPKTIKLLAQRSGGLSVHRVRIIDDETCAQESLDFVLEGRIGQAAD